MKPIEAGCSRQSAAAESRFPVPGDRAKLEVSMCRSIKVLRKPGQATTPEELSGAALQFVRKISGFHKPSRANQEAFERAVREISESSDRLLRAIGASVARETHGTADQTSSTPVA